MLIVIFSDVHGNLPALEKMLQETNSIADAYICLGDTVNYGPWSNECIEIISQLPRIVILEGNNERLYNDSSLVSQQLPIVQKFVTTTVKDFTRYDLIVDLPKTYELDKYCCIHTVQNKSVYKDTKIQLDNNYIIGHTHQQYMKYYNEYTLVNPGSVGQNRAIINIAEYILYDTDSKKFVFRSIAYNFDTFLKELRSRKYPQECIDYYMNKKKL